MKKIFIADFLPLANKGEEEIIRGIETLYTEKDSKDIEFRVFGNVQTTTQVGNVKVYPRDICYPLDAKYVGKRKVLRDIWMAIKGYLGYYPYKYNINSYPGLLEDIKSCDQVLIGHDGFFNLRCSLFGLFLARNMIHYAILGAGFNRPGKKIAWIYDHVYKKCFDSADYIILREQTAYNYVKHVSSNKKVLLLPDPAFFCPNNQYNKQNILQLCQKYRIDKNHLNIGITICENSISFSTAFVNSSNKVIEHREFIKNLLIAIYKETKCRFYFLPHCIEEGAGNDLKIANDIVSRLKGAVDCEIITEDLPVLDIKNIISRMDIMIGERTHSIINSISTETPFVALTCSADFRTHDIVGDGCGLHKYVYNLDNPNLSDIIQAVLLIIKDRTKVLGELRKVCLSIENKRKQLVQII